MLHYRRVLCAVDFSKESAEVVARAHMIAKHSDAEFCLVHVLEHSPMAYGCAEAPMTLNSDLDEALRDYAKQCLTKMVEEIGDDKVSWHLVEGSIKQGVMELAEELTCDLIVVGCHGHHGMGMLFGGNASGILHAAHCDVLAVHVEP